jgi:hypothetical protein
VRIDIIFMTYNVNIRPRPRLRTNTSSSPKYLTSSKISGMPFRLTTMCPLPPSIPASESVPATNTDRKYLASALAEIAHRSIRSFIHLCLSSKLNSDNLFIYWCRTTRIPNAPVSTVRNINIHVFGGIYVSPQNPGRRSDASPSTRVVLGPRVFFVLQKIL